ncbi:MAG: hypothetical protein RLZZ292_776 [Bacteroidota bacterium]|jgi:hypothetical protein
MKKYQFITLLLILSFLFYNCGNQANTVLYIVKNSGTQDITVYSKIGEQQKSGKLIKAGTLAIVGKSVEKDGQDVNQNYEDNYKNVNITEIALMPPTTFGGYLYINSDSLTNHGLTKDLKDKNNWVFEKFHRCSAQSTFEVKNEDFK